MLCRSMGSVRSLRFGLIGKDLRASSVKKLLLATEIGPGDWIQIHESAWKTGVGRSAIEEAKRARKAGSISAGRIFRDNATHRYLILQIIPFASPGDAISAVPKLPGLIVPNPNTDVQLVSERQLEVAEIPQLTDGIAIEQTTRGPRGQSSIRFIIAAVNSAAIFVSGSSMGEIWDWSEVLQVWRNQVSKIENN